MLIDAQEAMRRLGVKPDTLYAYVSRGLIRATATPGSKKKRYYEVDIERLKRNRRKGRRTGAPPPSHDRFAPVLDTALCLIEDGRLYYRGVDATDLAEKASLEEVAALLWGTGNPTSSAGMGPFPPWLVAAIEQCAPSLNAVERAKVILLSLAANDITAFDTTFPVVSRVGQLLASALAASLTGKPPRSGPIHLQLAKGWRLDAEGADLIRRCLVLSADHELNASTYVARCVASTGASPYAVVLAALCSFSGPLHGGNLNSRRGNACRSHGERQHNGEGHGSLASWREAAWLRPRVISRWRPSGSRIARCAVSQAAKAKDAGGL